jgi:predicted lipoprotein with Yx(FWY)xxD motif
MSNIEKTSFLRPLRILLALAAFAAIGSAMAVDALEVSGTEEIGSFLVDGQGMTLYVFLPDEASESTCSGDCAEAWPPVAPPDGGVSELSLGDDVDGEMVAAIERDDGSMQLTYNGWPLYYFARDAEAGDASGQGAGEKWYVVSPEGEPVGAPEAAASGGQLASMMEEGQVVYEQTCASCHGEDGDEANGAHVVKIVESERGVRNAGSFIRRVLYGASYMPGFVDSLSDREVAAVVTYVRNSWGFDYGLVTEEEVVTEREKFE